MPGLDEAEGDQRKIGHALPEQRDTLIKRGGLGAGTRAGNQPGDHLPFGGRSFEKIAVEKLEIHSMRFAIRAGVLCAIVASALAAVPAPSLPVVLARMRAAAGPVYLRHIVSSVHVVKADVTLRDDMQSVRFSISQCSGTICTGSYFDGYRYYAVNMNATALPRGNDTSLHLRGLHTILGGAFLNPGFAAEGGRIEDAGTAIENGVLYRKLLVQNSDALPMEVFVDTRSWLVAGVSDVNGDEFLRIHAYKKIGDVVLPFEYVRAGGGLVRYDSRAVSPSPFESPRGLRSRRVSESNAILDPETDTPIAACSLAGAPARCLIDSGNSGISVSLELAEQLRLQPVGAFEVRGLGRYATEIVRTGPLFLAGMEFPEANYAVLNDIHRFGYDVVIGADVLATSPVIIDYAAHTLAFGTDPAAQGSTSIALGFENFVPVVPVRLGATTATLAVDTGDESTINLSYPYYAQHTNLFKPSTKAAVSGIGGDSVELLGDIPEVRIGQYEVAAQHIGTTQTLRGTADGHLGDGFLRHFRVGLDYANARITLRPRIGDGAVTSRSPL